MECTDIDYAFLRELVLNESANLIDPSRNALFEARLTPMARLAGAQNLADFVSLLRVDHAAHMHSAVAEAMTINETSFFRDPELLPTLRDSILPRLLERRSATKRLRIWSAATSTGQEAYSLAMLLCEYFPQLEGWDVKIIGTDISRKVIDYAQNGRYRRLEVNRGLPARMLVKYFRRDGEEWEILPQVRSLCDFHLANLCAPFPPLPVFDLVLLRNVLDYFPEQDRSCVFSDVYRQLASDGFLVVGGAEQPERSTNLFEAEFGMNCYFYHPILGA